MLNVFRSKQVGALAGRPDALGDGPGCKQIQRRQRIRSVCVLVIIQALAGLSGGVGSMLWAGPQEHLDRAVSLYQEKKFDQAVKEFEQAKVDRPDDHRIDYNLSNAQYQAKQYDQAPAGYMKCLVSPEDNDTKARSAYNLGNNSFRLQKYEDAAKYYLKALALNPQDEEARYNLEYTLKEMTKQKEKEKDSQSSKDNNDNKKDDKDKDRDKKKEDQPKDQPDNKDQSKPDQSAEPGKKQDHQDNQTKPPDKPEQPEPKKQGQAQPGETKDNKQPDQPAQPSTGDQNHLEDKDMDKKKAAALLDNLSENRKDIIRQNLKGAVGPRVVDKDW
ncbi:MAG: tetratricopeptide repeat protein [Deltaproteobacteria bacterium]|nr:tetratricopeptide repeat protein [Deltaproteobacteria bacterium]